MRAFLAYALRDLGDAAKAEIELGKIGGDVDPDVGAMVELARAWGDASALAAVRKALERRAHKDMRLRSIWLHLANAVADRPAPKSRR
jgi:hypothetical protein